MTANHIQAGYPSEDYGTTENLGLLEELQKKDEIQQLYCLLQQEQAQNASLSSTLGSQQISFTSMLQQKDKQLDEKDKQLGEKDKQLEEKDRQLQEKDREFEEMIRKLQETVRHQQELLRQLREKDKQRAERWNQIACSVCKDQELASGSWGVVYKGTLPVAIKELKNVARPESLKLFRHEMEAAFFCHHPNIVEFLGATIKDLHPPPYIVMELMDCNLRDFIKLHEQLPLKIIVSIALDVAKGLSYLHGQNPPILHRDLKTDNILLKRETAKIGDLGCAKVQQDNMTPYCGTLLYTAPEVLKENIQTPKMDVWSYGLVVLEMATGTRPDPSQMSQQIQQISYSKLRELVTACTHIQPNQRPSMSAVVRVLKEKFT